MNLSLMKKLLSLSVALVTVSLVSVAVAAPKERGLLADGELFASERVLSRAKVLYNEKITPAHWVWHNAKGYPAGLELAAFVYGDNLPQVPGKGPVVNGVPKPGQMTEVARNQYAVSANKNSLVLYATTGPSAAQTEIKITKVELYGRLLNVVVAMKDAEPNKPLTMNITYPETMVKISRKKLPSYGTLRLRFVDLRGHTLKNEDLVLHK